MKKIISVILLIAAVFTLTACDRGGTDTPSPTEVFTVGAIDQSGMPVEGVKLMICEGTRVVMTVVTDGDGKAYPELYPGKYTLRIESLPEGYERIVSRYDCTFTAKTPTCIVQVKNNIGDGTEKNPYIIKDRLDINIPADRQAFYRVEPSGEKTTLVIREAARLTATYNGVTYKPVSGDMIVIDIGGEGTVFVRNKGDAVSTVAELVYPFGTEKNPHTVRLDTDYRVDVTDRTVYYAHTATVTETITLVGSSGAGVYTVKNLTTGEILTGEGECEIAVGARLGDQLLFIITGTGEIFFRFNTPDWNSAEE